MRENMLSDSRVLTDTSDLSLQTIEVSLDVTVTTGAKRGGKVGRKKRLEQLSKQTYKDDI